VLLPDNDAIGLEHMNAVAQSLNGKAQEIKIVQLPGLPQKGDVDDFIAAHGANAAEDLLKLIQAAPVWKNLTDPSRRPRLRSVSDILTASSQEFDWLVKDLLVVGSLAVLGAKPKFGKSTGLRDLGTCVARGEPFLNRPTKQGPVIYVCLEDSDAILGSHVRKLGLIDSDPFTFITERPTLEHLRELIQEHRPVLVIIDPLYRFANITKVDDYVQNMNALVPLEGLCKEFGVTICVAHHAVKGGRDDPFDAFLGSTSIFGSVETGIILVRDPKTDVRTIRTRSRHGRDLDETVIELDPVSGRITLGKTVEEIDTTARQEKAESIETAIIAFLSAHFSSNEEEIRATVTGKTKSIRYALDKLRYTFQTIPVEDAAVEI
jgi:hypothetical protein